MKILVLVRHAHRDRLEGESDNGLSAKGLKQAKAVRRFFKRRYGRAEPAIFSSPKVRCIETLEPLARWLNVPIERLAELDEGGSLDGKIRAFRDHFVSLESPSRHPDEPELVVACSHGDWIPRAIELWTGTEIFLDKGGWAELRWTDDKLELAWVVQSPRACLS